LEKELRKRVGGKEKEKSLRERERFEGDRKYSV